MLGGQKDGVMRYGLTSSAGSTFNVYGWTCNRCGHWVQGNAIHLCGGSYPYQFWPMPERKPYKCPVCKLGRVNKSQANKEGDPCPACKGECVLWG